MLPLDRVIGHRGACAYAPENTLASFNKAVELGCRFIEFDVMLNGDGDLFVFHDETLKRTTNGRGEFGLAKTDYVNSLDAGRWFSRRFRGEKIPTLPEVLVWLLANNMQANIEIKPYPGQAEQTAIALITHLNRYWPHDRELPLVSSFELDALRLCRSLAPEMPMGLLLDNWQADWLKIAKELNCFSLHINRRVLTKTWAQEIKKHPYKLCVYTVNRKRQAAKLFDWGVDAIFSDYPDLLS